MSLFHRHQWVEVGRTYVPPAVATVKRCTPELARHLAFGFTSVELRCAACGALTSCEMDGNHVPHNGRPT